MTKKLSLTAAMLATVAGAMLPATAADAQRYRGGYEQGYNGRDYRGDYEQGYNGRTYRGQDSRTRYREPRKCSDGTTGAIIGAIAGGLLGRVLDRGGDRSTGTLLGAGGGALAGRAIDRDGAKQAAYDGRCYR